MDGIETARVLLEYGADIDMVDNKYGRGALHWAVYLRCVKLVPFFVQNKARMSLKDKHGMTPLVLAKKQQFPEIVAALLVSFPDRQGAGWGGGGGG